MKKDWVECKLGEIVIYSKGKKPKVLNNEKTKDLNIPYINIKAFEKGIYDEYTDGFKCNLCNDGDLLMVWDGARSGLTGRAKKGAVGSTLMKIEPSSSFINKEYLYYFLSSKYVLLNTNPRGVGIPHVEPNLLWNSKFIIHNIPIQRAIVAKIEELFSSLDSAIADLTKAQKQLVIYRQAVLKKAFEGELTKEWREKKAILPTAEELLEQIKEERQRHYEQQLEDWKKAVKAWEESGKEGKRPTKPTKLKDLTSLTVDEIKIEIPIPKSWVYKKIGNITDCIVPNRDKPKSFNGNIYWVTTPDLNLNSIIIDYQNIEKGLTKEECDKYNARIIPVHSVIMTCVGMLGTSSIVEKEMVINQQLHAYLPSRNYTPKYLAYVIRFNSSYLERSATATTVKYLNKTKCNSLPFPLCSIQEQHQIVREIESRLSVCDKVEESIVESLEKAKALRQSILKKAFEGKLLTEEEIAKCKQEKDYEPARKLLERIKGEKKK